MIILKILFYSIKCVGGAGGGGGYSGGAGGAADGYSGGGGSLNNGYRQTNKINNIGRNLKTNFQSCSVFSSYHKIKGRVT